jgi:flagellin-like protein
MAKGISAVIATIMLLMITVALISVFYVFGSGLMSTTTGAAGATAASTTERMLKTIALPIASCDTATNVMRFVVQNVGTKNIVAAELVAYVDDVVVVTVPNIVTTGVDVNQQKTFTYTSSDGQHTLRIVGPSNAPVALLTC